MDCILFTGYIDRQGYGRTGKRDGKQIPAHRAAWLDQVGAIPEGHHLHHTCGTRACVNVAHLEPVLPGCHSRTHRDQRTHCRRGHSREEWGQLERGSVWRCRRCHGSETPNSMLGRRFCRNGHDLAEHGRWEKNGTDPRNGHPRRTRRCTLCP